MPSSANHNSQYCFQAFELSVFLNTTRAQRTSDVSERQGLFLKLESHIFVHVNVGRPRTFDIRLRCSTRSSNVLRSTPLKTQQDERLSSFLVTKLSLQFVTALLVSHPRVWAMTFYLNTLPKTWMRMFDVPKRPTFGVCERCIRATPRHNHH